MSKFVTVTAAVAALVAAGAALAQPVFSVAPTVPQPTAITVFDQPNFKGRALTFQQSVPSLAKLQFNDVISSVQIKGRDWVLCEHRNFMGKCVRVHDKEKNLSRLKILGQVSSLYPVPLPPPPPPKPR